MFITSRPRPLVVLALALAALQGCKEDSALKSASVTPPATYTSSGFAPRVTPPVTLLSDPIPLDPIVNRLHLSEVHEAIVITFRIQADGSVKGCRVERPKLAAQQLAEICRSVEARLYAPGQAVEVSIVSSVHLR